LPDKDEDRCGGAFGESLRQFEVIVILSYKQLDRLAGGFGCGDKFAVLALKFGGLAGAVGQDERPMQMVEMPYRA
jgi:hypothetical protein